jgi:hypothetical protein
MYMSSNSSVRLSPSSSSGGSSIRLSPSSSGSDGSRHIRRFRVDSGFTERHRANSQAISNISGDDNNRLLRDILRLATAGDPPRRGSSINIPDTSPPRRRSGSGSSINIPDTPPPRSRSSSINVPNTSPPRSRSSSINIPDTSQVRRSLRIRQRATSNSPRRSPRIKRQRQL